MSEYIVELDSKHSIALKIAFAEEMRGGDFVRGEIVRCRDCEHYRFVDRSDIFHDKRHNDSFCLRFVDGKRMEVETDDFCSRGERRSE